MAEAELLLQLANACSCRFTPRPVASLCCRSHRRQRTTLSRFGSGPASTQPANSVCCASPSLPARRFGTQLRRRLILSRDLHRYGRPRERTMMQHTRSPASHHKRFNNKNKRVDASGRWYHTIGLDASRLVAPLVGTSQRQMIMHIDDVMREFRSTPCALVAEVS